MTTALAVIPPDELETIKQTGSLLASSGYFKDDGGKVAQMAQLATKILAGRELGFGPFASVNGIYIVKGRPSVGANLMATAVKSSSRYDYRVKESTSTNCAIEFFEIVNGKRESIGISAFSADEARKAGTQNMEKFPKNMLFARAMSNGVRFFCPDVFSGNAVYTPEEMGATVNGEGDVIEVQGRSVDTATGEIVDDDMGMAQPKAAPHTNGKASPHKYADLIDNLTGTCATLANKMRSVHQISSSLASEKQYQFLAGTLDELTHKGAHNAILEVIVGRTVTGENPCGKDLASKLLDYLIQNKKVDGEEVANPNYREDVVNCIKSIYELTREADGQLRLVEA